MADFTFIKDQGVWINLDLVIRIETGTDEKETRSVIFVDGSALTISETDVKRLVKPFRPKKKKRKKKKEASADEAKEAASVEGTGQPMDTTA